MRRMNLGLRLFLLCFSAAIASAEPKVSVAPLDYERSDINEDGQVDAEDLLILMNDWGKVTAPAPMIETVQLPAGSFLMGSTDSIENEPLFLNPNEMPQHQVTFNYLFRVGRYEVTTTQYAEVMNWAFEQGLLRSHTGNAYSGSDVYHNGQLLIMTSSPLSDLVFLGGRFVPAVRSGQSRETHPVNQISWYGAVAFCNWLSEMEDRTLAYDLATWTLVHPHGGGYRLPSESEWEYACRGSAANPHRYDLFHFGRDPDYDLTRCIFTVSDLLDAYMVWCGNSWTWSQPVGSRLPNDYGLHDMHGNIQEWCEDYGHENYNDAPADGSAWLSPVSEVRMMRSSSWYFNATMARSSVRHYVRPDKYENYTGFRVVRTSSAPPGR